jgi:hypothetical protein
MICERCNSERVSEADTLYKNANGWHCTNCGNTWHTIDARSDMAILEDRVNELEARVADLERKLNESE